MSDFTQPRITEKKYTVIPPTALTANGTTDGLITIVSTYCFKVGQCVLFKQGATFFKAKIQRVISETQFIVIDENQSIVTTKKLDMSAFLIGATVELMEVKRPVIDILEIQRQVYEEEPTVALRTHQVDWLGRSYDASNPMPVQLSNGNIDIGTVNAELEVQLTHIDNYPDAGDVADSVRIGDGTETLEINPDGSINVVFSPFPSGGITPKSVYAEVSSVASATLTTVVAYTVPVGKKATLERISMSGQNIATYTAEVNSVIVDKKRTWFNGPMSEEMNFITSSGGSIQLAASDVVRVRVVHNRPAVADFNARIDIIEIN